MSRAKYNSTPPTVSDNGWTDLQVDSAGNLKVSVAPVASATAALSASATFTPAAAEHTNGDINGTAGTFALGARSGSAIRIISANLAINGDAAETTAWRLHMFNVTPPSALADGDAFTLASGDRASYLGYIDFAQTADLGDTQFIETTNIQKQINLAGTGLFGYLVNGTTLTPAAVAHIVTIKAEQL